MDTLILVGIGLIAWGIWRLRKSKKYEFENRSNGGTVGFKDFSAAQRHDRITWLAGFAIAVGMVLVIIGGGVESIRHH